MQQCVLIRLWELSATSKSTRNVVQSLGQRFFNRISETIVSGGSTGMLYITRREVEYYSVLHTGGFCCCCSVLHTFEWNIDLYCTRVCVCVCVGGGGYCFALHTGMGNTARYCSQGGGILFCFENREVKYYSRQRGWQFLCHVARELNIVLI